MSLTCKGDNFLLYCGCLQRTAINFFSEDDSDDGEGDAASKRRSNPEAKGASKRIKIGMSESKALSM